MSETKRKAAPSVTRRSPQGPWSPGIAVFREPNRYSRWEMKIAILYPCRESLLADYDRAARWKYVRGAVSRTHSASLEKTPAGDAWLDFGVRHYLAQPLAEDAPSGKALERPEDRIAVHVAAGGMNRMKIIRDVTRVQELVVVFNLYDTGDPADLDRQLNYLLTDHLGPMPGTYPIRLSGLFTLGHLAFTAGRRARHAEQRRLRRSS